MDRPWTASYAAGVPADIDVPHEALYEPLFRSARAYPHHTALDFFGRTTSYRSLAHKVLCAAQVLRDHGVTAGMRVAIALPNCPQHVVAFYAIARLGAVAVEINPTFTREEIAHELKDSGCEVVVCWQRLLGTMRDAAQGTAVREVFSADLVQEMPFKLRLMLRAPVPKARRTRAQLRGPVDMAAHRWEVCVHDASALPDDVPGPDPEDCAALLYTSGTTGIPRAAQLSHRNLLSVSAMGEAWVPSLRRGEEVFYAALPFFHSFGMQLCLLFAVRMAATMVIFPSFSTSEVLAAQRRRPATFFPGVPAMFARTADGARDKGVDLHSVKVAISGAMALPTETAAAWEQATGGLIIEGYGMTETAPILLGNPVDSSRRPGYLGLPFPSTEIKIVDPEQPERQVKPGERGELLVRGPQVTKGYWNRPAETKACLLEDNWWRTGDIVTVEDSGFVKLVDRVKEIIISGGYNVYPSQVEELVRQMPQVADVAVVGLPAEGAMGERVVAAIVLTADSAKLDLEQVRDWCADRLAQHAWPRDMVILPELPQSQIGKVLRRVVRDQLLGRPRTMA